MDIIFKMVSSGPYFFTVLLIGMTLGVLIHSVVSFVRRPYADRLMCKERAKLKKNLQDYRQTNLNLVEEIIFWKTELEKLRQLHFSQSKTNRELSDVIVDLSTSKNSIQDKFHTIQKERDHFCIECDKLRAQVNKLTSPAYVHSGKSVNVKGKLE